MDGAERNATIHYIQEKINACQSIIKDSEKSTREAIRDWAISLKRLTELGEREGPLSLIASEIKQVCKNNFGWTDNQCDLIRHVLDSEFKDHRFDRITKEGGSKSSLENLIESQDKRSIKDLETIGWEDKEQLLDYFESTGIAYRKAEQACYTLGLLEERKNENKISINDIKLENMDGEKVSLDLLIKQGSLLENNFRNINKKLRKYPVKDERTAKELNYYILDLSKRIGAINNVLQRLGDDKGTLSIGGWQFYKGFSEDYSLGGLGSLLGRIGRKKPTTKGIKNAFLPNHEEWEKFDKAVAWDSIDFIQSIRVLIWHLNNYYDLPSISDYSTVRDKHQDNMHDKRSDAA